MTPSPDRIADVHSHFPMHVWSSRSPARVADRKVCSRGRWWWLDGPRVHAFNLLAWAATSSRGATPWRVSFEDLKTARAGLVISALHDPLYEWLVLPLVQQRPRRWAFQALICQLDCVEKELARVDPGNAAHCVAKTVEELDDALDTRRMAFVHCVEGGYHLGRNEGEIIKNVETLAQRGVAYVTLAHIFYRGYATCVSAIPFLSDKLFNRIPQFGKGLSKVGKIAVREMYRHKIAIDVSHMDQDALDDTFALLDMLDEPDPAQGNAVATDPRDHPVIATHAGYRFGDQAYMLSEDTIKQIQRRGGVIGIILARHQLHDGLTETDFKAVRCHIDRICEITGSHEYTCIGSDLDGFIKPISGIDAADDLASDLASWLRGVYSDAVANAILFGNAEGVVRRILPRP